jgi:hypothetical protein
MWNEKKDLFGLEIAYIIRIRAHSEPAYYSTLAAQEELALEHDDIVMLTRMTQDFSVSNGLLVKGDSIHYSTLAFMHMAGITAERAYGHAYHEKPFELEEERYAGVTALIDSHVGIEAIDIDETSLELPLNQTSQLHVNYTPSNTTEKGVLWTSSDERVASVNALGVVEPHPSALPGETVVITATSLHDSRLFASVLLRMTESIPIENPYDDIAWYQQQTIEDDGYDVSWVFGSSADHQTNLYDRARAHDKVAFHTYIPSTLVRTTWSGSPGESVIIPVSPGMRISAKSFQESGINGGHSNGIRISYMSKADAMGASDISQLTPSETYLEFSQSVPDSRTGLKYLTVPETSGTEGLRTRYMEVVFWAADAGEDRWFYNLDLNGW